jgi:uncharacterized small protein (DUF1192 family)
VAARKSMLDQEMDPNKFDLRTHLFDNNGRIVKTNHYALHVTDGVSYFERPMNSGNLWFENNQPAGRVERVADASGKSSKVFSPGAPHKVFEIKLEGDELLQVELQNSVERIAALEKELAAVRAERIPAPVPVPQPKAATPTPVQTKSRTQLAMPEA